MKFNKSDLILAPLSLIAIVFFSYLFSCLIYNMTLAISHFNIVIFPVIFYTFFVGLTFIAMKISRMVSPLKEGVFFMDRDQEMMSWKLQGFFYTFNLGLLCNTCIIPINLRAILYKILGANIGKSVMIGGKILEPPLVEIGDYTQLGEDVIVTAHAVEGNKVTLGKVTIGKNVTLGVNSIVGPGVKIGDNAIVAMGAVVAGGTTIPSNEIWGGVPAKRIK